MKKKLFSKKQKENKSETTQPVSPSEPKKHGIVFKFFGWVIFLSVLSLGCFLLYPELASSQASLDTEPFSLQEVTVTRENITSPSKDLDAVAPVLKIESVHFKQEIPSPQPQAATEQEPAPVQTEVPAQMPEKKEPETKVKVSEESLPTIISRHRFIKHPSSQYTILQAMAFKNAVLSHENCRKHVEALLHLEDPTEIMEKVIKTFLPYCLHQDTDRDNINVFLAHKKQAVLAIFQQKHSTFAAYFYALPWLVMDIHKIQPMTDEPMDVLDRLHTAILENDTENALIELNKLPQRIGAIFNDVRQKLLEQRQRLSVLDELIMSFTNKGE